jgi:DNA mismatch repair protein MutL
MILEKKPKGDFNPLGAFVPIGEDTKGKQISFGITTPARHSGPAYHSGTYNNATTSASSTSSAESFGRNQGVAGIDKSQIPSRVEISPKTSIEILKKYNTASADTEYNVSVQKTELTLDQNESSPEYKYIGEAFDCYVIVEFNGELLIIDKHAAHERVIFEDLKKARERDGRVASQTMMLPLCVLLTPDEASVAHEYKTEIESVGFEYNVFEDHADVIAIPSNVSTSNAEGLFVEMVDELLSGKGNPENTEKIRRERALYQIACKAAIKGGRSYDRSVIDWLLTRVLSMPDIIVCPHGRPIAYKITKNQLDRQFDRIK